MENLLSKILGIVVIVGLFIGIIYTQLAPTISGIGEDVDNNLSNTSVTDWNLGATNNTGN